MSDSVTIIDGATPQLAYWAQTWPQYLNKAMKSLGWMMQKEIKAGIRSGAPGGQPYAPLAGLRKGIRKGHTALKRTAAERRVLGKLANAVGYQYGSGKLTVGWLSLSAVQIGALQEQGRTLQISDKMRKFFFASGIEAPEHDIKIPARHTIEPMKNTLEPRMAAYVEGKIMSYVNGNSGSSAATSKRRYAVVGGWL